MVPRMEKLHDSHYLRLRLIDLNGTDMFLEHDQLVKYNPEVNWDKGIVQFIRCLKTYRIKHQDIIFKTRRVWATDTQDKK